MRRTGAGYSRSTASLHSLERPGTRQRFWPPSLVQSKQVALVAAKLSSFSGVHLGNPRTHASKSTTALSSAAEQLVAAALQSRPRLKLMEMLEQAWDFRSASFHASS